MAEPGWLGYLQRHRHWVLQAVKLDTFPILVVHCRPVVRMWVGHMRGLSVHVDRLQSDHDDGYDNVTTLFWGVGVRVRGKTGVLTICRWRCTSTLVGSRHDLRHVGGRSSRRRWYWLRQPTMYTWGLEHPT